MPSVVRVRSTSSTTFFLQSFERCERPTAASERTSGVHPGRLAQGPDEKSGRAGRKFGFIDLSLTEELHSGGGAWPGGAIAALCCCSYWVFHSGLRHDVQVGQYPDALSFERGRSVYPPKSKPAAITRRRLHVLEFPLVMGSCVCPTRHRQRRVGQEALASCRTMEASASFFALPIASSSASSFSRHILYGETAHGELRTSKRRSACVLAAQFVDRPEGGIGVDQRRIIVVVQHGPDRRCSVGRHQPREMARQLLGAPTPELV